ncbi:amidase [Stipitochalara longipes BDJ]|nr:amidase [Stipitochalara longipes BDJ]
MATPPWQEIAAQKREDRAQKIPEKWRIPPSFKPYEDTEDVYDWPSTSGFFTPEELFITESTATEVVTKIASGEWKAKDVTEAICKRASVAQQLLNCITEIYFDEAIQRAEELDAYFAKGGKTIGPLHGLPISLKDQFNIKGLDTTIGYVSRVNKPVSEESTLVTLLLEAGAILYVKTNVPATLMRGETVNNVFGTTCNPYNRKLTSGGSSGGESALVSFRGSFLGVGTDIGGSIRHPCSFTGLYGIRPSHGRVSYQRLANTYAGQEAVRSCAGPMCRSPEDCRLFLSTLAGQEPWRHDPQCLPIPWRTEEELLPKKLCFGFGMGDGTVTPSPPLRRAMEITKNALIAAGHEVGEYIPYEHMEAQEIITKMWSADAGDDFKQDIFASGEPFHPEMQKWIDDMDSKPKPTVFETWQNQQRRTLLATAWHERWEATKSMTGTGRPIDGLIMPSTPFPAIRHNARYPHHWGALSPLLDLTTGVFPVTRVDLDMDVIPSDWKPISDLDQKVMTYYGSPKNHENAPIGLVVIGRRLEEEKVTAMLDVIAKCL